MLILSLILPVNAVEFPPSTINPADYPSDITIDGDIKTITFDFSSLSFGYYFFEDVSGSTLKLGDFSLDVSSDSRFYVVQVFPFGQPFDPVNVATSNFGCLYIGDLAPGSSIDFSMDIRFDCVWENHSGSLNHRMQVERRWYYDLYDDSGAYITTVSGDPSIDIWELQTYPSDYSKLVFEGEFVFDGSIPANAVFVRPRVRVACVNSAEYNVLTFGVYQQGFDMSIDINTILESSNLQKEILDRLDQIINGRPDDNAESDKLDSSVSDKRNEFDNAMAGLESMQKPNISGISMGAGSSFTSKPALFLTGQISKLWETDIANGMIIALMGVLTLSYVIFGKKR